MFFCNVPDRHYLYYSSLELYYSMFLQSVHVIVIIVLAPLLSTSS